jgi:predicted alpha/beta hydrolase family esterase
MPQIKSQMPERKDPMTKKKNTPFLIRFVPWLFPKLEKFAPFLAQFVFKLAFYIPARYPVPEKERESEESAEKFFIEVDGNKIQVYSWGKGDDYVLLVHGWAGRATQFRKFIKPLEEVGYRVVGFDGPAHGNSGGLKTSIPGFEQVLKKIFDQLGVPSGIITHSFGGAATLYAASQGLPVTKLINIATPYVADEILKSYLAVLNGNWRSAEKFKSAVDKKSGKSFNELTALHSIQRLPKPLKLMVVHDEDDPEMLFLHAEAVLKIYPSAKLLRTKGLGHTRILKDDGVIRECAKFISEG